MLYSELQYCNSKVPNFQQQQKTKGIQRNKETMSIQLNRNWLRGSLHTELNRKRSLIMVKELMKIKKVMNKLGIPMERNYKKEPNKFWSRKLK